MRVVDSSGWIEYFTDGPLASEFEPLLTEPAVLITPTIVVFEVYKLIKRERSEAEALLAVAQMRKTRVIPLTESLALLAADLGIEHRLAMADSVVYATAQAYEAELATADSDFAGLPRVSLITVATEGGTWHG